MMYKFKASKYKNATAGIAKKEECISDFSVETPMTYGNHAAASARLVAFLVGAVGSGKVMVLDVNAKGRLGVGPTLNAHSDAITSLDFSPFNHCRLATAGADNTVKIWQLPAVGITEDYTEEPVSTLSGFAGRPECIAFHPTADDILGVACGSKLFICNVEAEEKALEIDVELDLIQSISWKKDGILIAATTKDCRLLVIDPRRGKVISESKCHANHKESRVVWLGETSKVLTTGFSSGREKEASIWEVSGEKPKRLQTEDFGSGTGCQGSIRAARLLSDHLTQPDHAIHVEPQRILMPFYDEDTGMIFLTAKGDSNVSFLEFFNDKDPPLKLATQQVLQNQTKGMCGLPKLGVDAAEGEVNRLFQLSQKILVPIPWKVPRRSLRDFPIDLFPETASDEPALEAQQWLDGQNAQRKKSSLEPSKRKPLRLESSPSPVAVQSAVQQPSVVEEDKEPSIVEKPKSVERKMEPTQEAVVEEAAAARLKPKYKPFTGVRQSKFRHWKCTVSHPSNHVTNVEGLSLSISPSTDILRCSELYAAVPLKGPGGQVGIIKLTSPGRMTSENSINLQNSKGITDMQWSPFDPSQLAVALESSNVKVWKIPKKNCEEMIEEPELVFKGHYSKPIVLCYHPLAENVIASGEVDAKILIWNTVSGETYFDLSYDGGEVMSLAWSMDGKYLASSSRDKKLRIFEPRKSQKPLQVGPGPEGSRASRLAWVCNDQFLAVSGFDSMSGRTISLHAVSDLASGPVASEDFPNSPSVFALHYDADSSTLFFTGKGDATLYSIEVSESEPPHLFRIATFSSDASYQGISFLSKKRIDPRKVEFAQAWCLAKTTLQSLSFTVPRVKMEYFQDDIFPPTPVTWEKTISASDWVKGGNKIPRKLDLRPKGMKLLSEAPPDETKTKKYESYDPTTYKTDAQKKEELLEAMSSKLDLDKELEQDTMEGVEEEEWDDY